MNFNFTISVLTQEIVLKTDKLNRTLSVIVEKELSEQIRELKKSIGILKAINL